MNAQRRRVYQRKYALRQRDRKCQAGRQTCAIDRHELDFGVDHLGRVTVSCLWCQRRRARQCMECGQPVRGRAWRCPAHLAIRKVSSYRNWRVRNAEQVRASARRYYQCSAARRRSRNEYKKRWRRENRGKVLLQKRRHAARLREPGPLREKMLAYHRVYNAAHSKQRQQAQQARAA